MIGKRTAAVVIAAGITTAAMVGCHSPMPLDVPTAPRPGVESQSGGLNQNPVNGLPPNQPIPGVQPIPGLQPIPGVPTASVIDGASSQPIPGVPAAPPTAIPKPNLPIPGVRPEPLPPEILHPDDVTVPKDLTVPAVSSP
jgi:hypothetical protein